MQLHYRIIILFFSFLLLTSCTDKKPNEALVEAYIEARNNFDIEMIDKMIDEDYQEIFQNHSIEIENKEDLYALVLWEKELSTTFRIVETISVTDSTVTIIEENTNYIDIAVKRSHRSFKTTYYTDGSKILKQSFDSLPGYKKQNEFNWGLVEVFEAYATTNNIPFLWDINQKSGKVLRKALELYANRKE